MNRQQKVPRIKRPPKTLTKAQQLKITQSGIPESYRAFAAEITAKCLSNFAIVDMISDLRKSNFGGVLLVSRKNSDRLYALKVQKVNVPFPPKARKVTAPRKRIQSVYHNEVLVNKYLNKMSKKRIAPRMIAHWTCPNGCKSKKRGGNNKYCVGFILFEYLKNLRPVDLKSLSSFTDKELGRLRDAIRYMTGLGVYHNDLHKENVAYQVVTNKKTGRKSKRFWILDFGIASLGKENRLLRDPSRFNQFWVDTLDDYLNPVQLIPFGEIYIPPKIDEMGYAAV